ncbi:retrovirus-related Pol polyprotein from transposon 17.6 [Trichonephila clavipes]|nr:retrovirus-related Pol polyprotein from transposon 17.6 [Trichonephila clavipes]
MAFLTKEKKKVLRKLAWEMGLVMAEDLRILDIKQLILSAVGSSLDGRFNRFNQAGSTSSFNRNDERKTDGKSELPPISCYGCGKLGDTKPRCPNCKSIANRDSANFGNISSYSCSSTPNQIAVMKLAVNGIWGTACADTGASHSIAGETLYLFLQREGVNFQKTRLSISLVDGHKSEVDVYTTSGVIRLEERVIRTSLIALSYTKANRTLLGMHFLQKAGIVLNLNPQNGSLVINLVELLILLKKQSSQKSEVDPILKRTPACCSMTKLNV